MLGRSRRSSNPLKDGCTIEPLCCATRTLIERYTLPEMGDLWTDTYKLKTWLQVEIAVCEAQAELGAIPAEAVAEIKAKANFDPKRVLEIEAEVRHDMIAFLTNVNEYVGDAGRYIHLGLTSSDVLDTALALQLVSSLDVLTAQLESLIQAIRYQAQQHRHTIMIGRSHGIHAEPITFGFKLAGWLAEVLRHRDRLCQQKRSIAVGKISGAVGTYANIDPQVEAIACQMLGLRAGYRFNPGRVARSTCCFCANVGAACRLDRALCSRNPQPSAYRCPGSGRIFRQRSERLVCDAAQA